MVLSMLSPGLVQTPRMGQTTVVRVNHKTSTVTMFYLLTLSVSNVLVPEAEH